jgi:hypothetical protein
LLLIRHFRQIDISQYPKFPVVPAQYGCGGSHAHHPQHDAGVEQSPQCHADIIYQYSDGR